MDGQMKPHDVEFCFACTRYHGAGCSSDTWVQDGMRGMKWVRISRWRKLRYETVRWMYRKLGLTRRFNYWAGYAPFHVPDWVENG